MDVEVAKQRSLIDSMNENAERLFGPFYRITELVVQTGVDLVLLRPCRPNEAQAQIVEVSEEVVQQNEELKAEVVILRDEIQKTEASVVEELVASDDAGSQAFKDRILSLEETIEGLKTEAISASDIVDAAEEDRLSLLSELDKWKAAAKVHCEEIEKLEQEHRPLQFHLTEGDGYIVLKEVDTDVERMRLKVDKYFTEDAVKQFVSNADVSFASHDQNLSKKNSKE